MQVPTQYPLPVRHRMFVTMSAEQSGDTIHAAILLRTAPCHLEIASSLDFRAFSALPTISTSLWSDNNYVNRVRGPASCQCYSARFLAVRSGIEYGTVGIMAAYIVARFSSNLGCVWYHGDFVREDVLVGQQSDKWTTTKT